MKKILFFIVFTMLSLFADGLPNSIKSSVTNVSNDTIQLSSNIPAGMSGIVIHNYGNGLSAITHAALSLGNGQASIQAYTAIAHPNIPTVQTAVQKNDTVIFGYFYQNALLIAPNQATYRQVTQKFKRTWTHPDIFALAFMQENETSLNMDILNQFANKNQIGLVLVITAEQLLVIDPISKQIIGNQPYRVNTNDSKTPFFARFDQMDTSVFQFTEKNFTPYFQSVAGLK